MTPITQLLRRRGVLVTILVVAAIATALMLVLPPAGDEAPPLTGGAPTVRGAYHIHSNRSDGSGTVDEIAEAARRAGLQFIILTDHGDGVRPPDAPQYRHGVLVIDAVELNTSGGHLVALGLPAAPYPLAGTPVDVLEDVHRLGGFGMAAHPDSARPSLQWQAWDAPIDGLEWINADSSWRDDPGGALGRAMMGYWFRPAEAVATLLDRPETLIARWDQMTAARPLPALAAADAHARISLRDPGADDDTSPLQLPVPGYEVVFRAFSNHVILDAPLSGDGSADAAAVLGAIRRGATFTVVDALATPGGLEFTAANAVRTLGGIGDTIPLEGDVTLRARISAPPGTVLRLLRDGVVVREIEGAGLTWPAGDAGVYRVEAHVAGAPGTPPVPWIFSNPIRVGLPHADAAIGDSIAAPLSRIPVRTEEVAVETGNGDVGQVSEAQVEGGRARRFAGEPPMAFQFALSPGPASGQFAALRLPVIGGLAAFDRLRFAVTSGAPMRAWVQLRAGQATERWGRTFYADGSTRTIELPLRSFAAIGATSSAAPPLEKVDSILFVVDTLNSRPGASGAMTIADVALVR
ncbi:MAG: hypothetical protein AB7N29_00585 [Vicinamibacterales bacterium]